MAGNSVFMEVADNRSRFWANVALKSPQCYRLQIDIKAKKCQLSL